MHPGEEGEKKKKKKAMDEKLGLPGWPHLGHQKHKKWSSFLCFTPQKITWRHYTWSGGFYDAISRHGK